MRVFLIISFLLLFSVPSFSYAEEDETSATEKTVEEIFKTCEAGLWRCNSIRDKMLAYWACMEDTCAAGEEKNPLCQEGKDECGGKLKDYRTCVNIICKNSINSPFSECAEGRKACGKTAGKYWDCVSQSCLGSVEPFVAMEEEWNAAEENREVRDEDFYREIENEQKEEEKETLNEREPIFEGTPASRLYCENKESSIYCASGDIRSCICSDGLKPLDKQ